LSSINEQPKRTIPRWVWIVVALSVAGFAALVCGGFLLVGAIGSLGGLSQPQPQTTAEIEALARIVIPPGATNIHAEAGGFQDRFIHVRFDIAPGELDTFLFGTRYTPAIGDNGAVPFQQSIEPQADWWQPRAASTYKSGSGFVDGVSQSVLIDTSNAERYVVYVATFET
jgi:hypothetical protein